MGDELKTGTLQGSGVALAVGVVVTLLSGLGVTLAAQTAFNRIYGVPMRERPDPIRSRLRGLGLLVVLGTLQIVSTVASGLVSAGFGSVLLTVAGVLLAVALNLLLFGAAFRLLTDRSVPTPRLWPGVVAAALLWTAVQSVGGAYLGLRRPSRGPDLRDVRDGHRAADLALPRRAHRRLQRGAQHRRRAAAVAPRDPGPAHPGRSRGPPGARADRAAPRRPARRRRVRPSGAVAARR